LNYYPRYPGDYLAKTLHLSMVEDGAYTRLLDWYYSKQQAIPHERRYAVARATTAAERAAADSVLREFFDLRDGAHHHARADKEIEEAAPRIAAAKVNGSKGGRRPKRNPADNPTGNPPGSVRDAQQASSPTPTPEETLENFHRSAREAEATPTKAGLMCRAMKACGVIDVNPGHPDLLALIAAGADAAEFTGAAAEAHKRGKGFAYTLAMLGRQRTEAAEKAKGLHQGPLVKAPEWYETPAGIKARGAELGLAWREDGWINGVFMAFPNYAERVKAAAKEAA
jgi:uncharacterized protein YdaU (DUF1376 family)